MPSTRSRMRPSPVLLTILLPRNPATMPRTIQARIDMCSSLTLGDLAWRQHRPLHASKLGGAGSCFAGPRMPVRRDPVAVEHQHAHGEDAAHSTACLRGHARARLRRNSDQAPGRSPSAVVSSGILTPTNRTERLSAERVVSGDVLADDEPVHVFRPLVRVHGLEVQHVADDGILVDDAVGAEDVARLAGDVERRADVVHLRLADMLGAHRALLLLMAT